MKKILSLIAIGLCSSFLGCSVFGPVDPIGPDVQTGSITEAAQTSFRISGTIKDPDYKNSRQRKKSGRVVEYGFAYGVSNDPGEGVMKKVGDTITTSPFEFNTVISGLGANTAYKVWAYARTEAGLTTYGNESGQQTTDFPTPNPVINWQLLSTVQNNRAPAATNFSTTDNTPGATFLWSFGENGATSTQKNPSYVYLTGGVKTITLTIKANGKEATRSVNLTILPPYQKVTITRIRLLGYQQSYPDGTGWDVATSGGVLLTGGPDMYIYSGLEGIAGAQFYTAGRNDATPAQLAAGVLFWATPWSTPGGMVSRTFTGADLTKLLSLLLRDQDGGTIPSTIHEEMGSIYFRLNEYMTGNGRYPATVTRQGAGDVKNSLLRLEISFSWAE